MPTHVRNDEPTIDRKVRAGDVAIDQAQGTWVYVMEQVAPDVATWNRENDSNLLEYAGNWQTGATLGDRVFAVVYLGGNGVKSYPSGSYDFPESRLARYAVEEANGSLSRVQTIPLRRLLTELLDEAKRLDYRSENDDLDDPDQSFEDFVLENAERAIQLSPMDYSNADEIVADADSYAEERFQDERERWENAQAKAEDVSDEPDVAEADLGTDDVSIDDSDLESRIEEATLAEELESAARDAGVSMERVNEIYGDMVDDAVEPGANPENAEIWKSALKIAITEAEQNDDADGQDSDSDSDEDDLDDFEDFDA